jgi:diaminohydroxyphosphoribosylaminopyrimidine deaminase/5-amino-6-(5-phosphoribosylamino)uracil reductase
MADERLHAAMIKKAMRLARKGEGGTSPNPIVGAVIYNHDGIIATGYHKKAGEPHAERIALARAGDRAKGASLAVNLEPCCHHGRTGPCTNAIIEAGIKEVVYSIEDPFPKVRGRGARILREHGINIIAGIERKAAARLNEVYLHYTTTGRPFVVLKTAQSLDGRIATRTGDSQWISSEKALVFGHKLRARYDAIAVGGGTVRADDPQLTVRRVRGRNPVRIVLTASGNIPRHAKILNSSGGAHTIIASTRNRLAGSAWPGVETWTVRKNSAGLDLNGFLDMAGEKGITSILFEGGERLATSLLKQGLVDKLYLLIAPMIIGDGVSAVGDLGIRRLVKAVRFGETSYRKLGTDIMFRGYPEK